MSTEGEQRIASLAQEWDRLADRVAAPPFARPGWFAAWWRAFGAGHLELLTVRRGQSLVGVLPLSRRRGGLHSLTNYHTPAFGPVAQDAEAVQELIRAAVASAPRRLTLAALDVASTDLDAIAEAAGGDGYRVITRSHQRTPSVEITGGWDSYLGDLSRRFRKELRRQGRRLDELGAVTVEVETGGERLGERLREAFAVESSGWKEERGTAMASRPETRRFYEEVARWAAESGRLRLFFLRLEGAPIAVDYALEDNGHRYILKGGFDADYARHSPGTLLLEAGLEDAFSRELRRVELGGGDDDYKLRWAPVIRERRTLQAFAPTLLGSADHAAVAVARPLAKRVLRR